ncbi:protein-L-isoaspartate O-methyltransferase [archaeon]|nr:protein-L-isoaspartate O-methyltransferase [archaeon]|tara:strand:+ start:213 stop:854 length:642 start_codon:yes stop_codon:yes gene_type:complete
MELKNELLTFWQKHYQFQERELQAFGNVDRAHFVTKEFQDRAYEDTPLPLLRGKTISQPTTVMIMTSALELKPGDSVFEVGTGSAYQAAIIGTIIGKTGQVYTTEVIPELIQLAHKNLKKANINNINVLEEEGSKGIPEKAPFDKIIITAACRQFPLPLMDQLKEGGIMVGPVGNRHLQQMTKARKHADGTFSFEIIGPFLFTPMYGKYGFEI